MAHDKAFDKAIKGNKLTRMPTRQPPKKGDAIEKLGIMSSGGHKGKPHSTPEGRKAAGARTLSRFFYGRGKKKTRAKERK